MKCETKSQRIFNPTTVSENLQKTAVFFLDYFPKKKNTSNLIYTSVYLDYFHINPVHFL